MAAYAESDVWLHSGECAMVRFDQEVPRESRIPSQCNGLMHFQEEKW
jgi:hypothetical protein